MNTPDKQAFVLTMTDGRLEKGKAENVIGSSCCEAEDLNQITDWEEFKSSLRKSYPELYKGD